MTSTLMSKDYIIQQFYILLNYFFLFYTHMTIWQGDWGAIRMSVAGLNIRMKVWPLSLTFNTVVVPMCTSALLPCTKGGCGVLLGKTTPSAQAASVVPGKPNNRPSKCLVTGFTQAAILILILILTDKTHLKGIIKTSMIISRYSL